MLTDDLVDRGRRADPARLRLGPTPSPAASRLADRLLAGPLTVGLIAVGFAQLAMWVPHYLTWPYWADHDAFATAARAWAGGALPYRDTYLNQFPGSLYLYYALGKVAGWGKPWGLYAFDASLLVAFEVL